MDTQHSREVRERRAEIAKQMADLANKAREEDRSFTAEEREQFDRMDEDCRLLLERAKDAERLEDVQRSLEEPAGQGGLQLTDGTITHRPPADRDKVVTRRDVDLAMRAWALREEAPQEWKDAAKKVGISTARREHKLRLANSHEYAEMRRRFREDGIAYRATTAQSKGTTTAGGFTVPTELATTLERALLNYGGMRAVATVMRTAGGEDLNIPTADDTTTLASVLAENTAASVSDLTFQQTTLRAAKYSSGIVLASIELLQDTAIDLVGYVGDALGTRLARGTHADYTTGTTATTSPRGIIRDTFQGFAATTASGDISLTTLTEMVHAVDIEYRNMGGGWMMHDKIVKEVRQVVDSQGRPLWQPGLQVGSPDQLLGYPITVNNRLVSSTTGSGQQLLLFGALSKYMIRDVMDIDVIRFDEKYMNSLQVGWLGVMRTDGRLLLASTRNASKPVAHLKGTT